MHRNDLRLFEQKEFSLLKLFVILCLIKQESNIFNVFGIPQDWYVSYNGDLTQSSLVSINSFNLQKEYYYLFVIIVDACQFSFDVLITYYPCEITKKEMIIYRYLLRNIQKILLMVFS